MVLLGAFKVSPQIMQGLFLLVSESCSIHLIYLFLRDMVNVPVFVKAIILLVLILHTGLSDDLFDSS